MSNKLIAEARELCAEPYSAEYIAAKARTLVPELVDALEEAEKQIPRWIPVSERLPEIPEEECFGGYGRADCLVIARKDNPFVTFMEYKRTKVRGKIIYRWEWNDRISPWEVTHWMPLPKGAEETE